MITVRRSGDRGRTNLNWLDSRHTFSFSDYYDSKWMGFRQLRVINEDRVKPGAGFPSHSHHDMEIISYVLEGALEHKDSTGTNSVIHAGEIQRMTAGTGITHSEFNPSKIDPVHFLQIWILPNQQNLEPAYEQRPFAGAKTQEGFRLVVSPDGRENSMTIHQDVELYLATLSSGEEAVYEIKTDRHAWMQIIGGNVTVNEKTLQAGDGAAISNEEGLEINASDNSDILLFDLA
jgi:redox-sensitive bicupin YhaK (pirin superfamily)